MRLGDEAGLLLLVPRPIEPGRRARRVLGPQRLVLALDVVGDHPSRQRQDALGRAIVLLQPHDLGAGKVLLEIEDVADVGAAPLVDRLIAVADHAHVAMLGGQQLDDPVLGAVGVLVLVDQDVAPEPAVPGQDLRNLRQQAHDQQEQVVEVHGAGLPQPLVVAGVDERGLLLPRPAGVAQRLGHRDHLVLEIRDAVHGRAGREGAVGQLAVLHALLDQRQTVVLVVDREVRGQAEMRAVLPQDPDAGRMEGRDERGTQADRAQQLFHAAGHLAGGLVGEGHGQEIARRQPALEQPRDAIRDDPGLAAAGAREHQQRAIAGRHGFTLSGVQIVEEALQVG